MQLESSSQAKSQLHVLSQSLTMSERSILPLDVWIKVVRTLDPMDILKLRKVPFNMQSLVGHQFTTDLPV